MAGGQEGSAQGWRGSEGLQTRSQREAGAAGTALTSPRSFQSQAQAETHNIIIVINIKLHVSSSGCSSGLLPLLQWGILLGFPAPFLLHQRSQSPFPDVQRALLIPAPAPASEEHQHPQEGPKSQHSAGPGRASPSIFQHEQILLQTTLPGPFGLCRPRIPPSWSTPHIPVLRGTSAQAPGTSLATGIPMGAAGSVPSLPETHGTPHWFGMEGN